MTSPNDERESEQRDTIGSIRSRWRPLHSVFFVMQSLLGMGFIVWLELAWITGDSSADTIKAMLWGIAVVGGASMATTVTFSEAFELMLGTRDMINEWLQKRRDEARRQGRVEEREELRAKAQDWYARLQAASEKGEPFDEPPPWDDKDTN